MKSLIDYVKAIEGKVSPYKFVNKDSQQSTKYAAGSTIDITKHVYHFDDGVSVEYEREYDDGSGYPGCKEFWYTYKVISTNGFEFEGETSRIFQSSSDIRQWLKTSH